VPLGLEPSFGFGDRIGLATPGHVAALVKFGSGILPIFPQQSIREMARTARSPRQVMDDALEGMMSAGWTGPTGADADHLRTEADVDATAAVGFTFFTIDPSDHVDRRADDYDEPRLRAEFASVAPDIDWYGRLLGKVIPLSTGTSIVLDEAACMKAAVKYGRAINRALTLSRHIACACEKRNAVHEIELSVDETDQPTSLAEHFVIAHECLRGEMRLVSLAPRFIGDFEKGVDYKGDLGALERSLGDHAAIAEILGPYKLSLHSGSDKLSIYPLLARATSGRFHVKTAGTSYLEALRVIARRDGALFKRIVDFARTKYDTDKATYHVSATLASAPPTSDVPDVGALERHYLGLWSEVEPGRGFTRPGRQILHCTFGSVLTDAELGPTVKSVLEQHADTYTEILEEHFSRHLNALEAGM
jgi:hypothetical protein